LPVIVWQPLKLGIIRHVEKGTSLYTPVVDTK